jgi:hypothetical protein
MNNLWFFEPQRTNISGDSSRVKGLTGSCSGPELPFEEVWGCRFLGALLVHFNLQMRPSGCNWEQVKSLKRREDRRAQTGQVGLANRRLMSRLKAILLPIPPTTLLKSFL